MKKLISGWCKMVILFMIVCFTLWSCIGDDIINDTIEPEMRISNAIDSIGLGSEFQFEALYFNNIGKPEAASITWSSSNSQVIEITGNGLARGLAPGNSVIAAEAITAGGIYQDEFTLKVGKSTASPEATERTGTIRSTSSYKLEGGFALVSIENNKLRLSIGDNYVATTALPALHVYLSNNPASISEAFEIGEVKVFTGAHSYEIAGVGLNDFSYLLYYCKPFNVKVGEGKIEN